MTKCQVDRMANKKMVSWQNNKLTKCQVDRMANKKMASWQDGKLTKWQVDKMAKHHHKQTKTNSGSNLVSRQCCH